MSEWDESKHPRQDNGQFGTGSSESTHEIGAFGKIYTEFHHDAQGAIAKLKAEQGGEAAAALYHPDIGDIDLVWGIEGTGNSDGYGLSKLIKYHPEVIDNLQGIILTTKINAIKSGQNRLRLYSEKYEATVSLNWYGEEKTWLLTAFETDLNTKKKNIGTDKCMTATSYADEALSSTNVLDSIIEQIMMNFQADKANKVLLAMDKSMRSYDGNGHLIVKRTVITKAAVNPYLGREIPNHDKLGLEPDKIYHLLRAPEELEKALSSFHGVQLLIKHTPVCADEPHNNLTVGSIGTDAKMDGNDVYASLRVFDQSAIDLIESGKLQELSAGYAYTADMTAGEWNGQPYDGVMRNIHGNHVALVERGRIGRAAIISDHLPVELMEQSMKLKKGSMPKIMAALQKIAQDADISQDAAEEVIKTVGDSLETEEPKAADTEPDKLAQDAELDKSDAEDDDEPKAEDEESDDGKKPAMDADTIRKAAVAEVTALFEARDAVKPLVGVVAMDSAEDVYKFALQQKGINITGVHPSAYKAMTGMLLQSETKPASVAMDAAIAPADELTARFG